MKAYSYRGMDNSGKEEHGFLDADSEEMATAELRERGLFVTALGLFDPEVTPEWSDISLASPSSIPSGRLIVQGLPCTIEQKGMPFDGFLNLLGEEGELHLVFDRQGGMEAIIDLPIQAIRQVQQKGFFRKRLVFTTSNGDEHIFRGSLSEIQRLYDWAMFAIEKAASSS